MKGWYDEFYNLSKEGLTADETAKLRASLQTITDNAQQGINQLQQATGINLTQQTQSQSSLAGGIKQIQEDTANVLAGTTNAIRITALQQRDIAMDSLAVLVKIEKNTSSLSEIRDLIKAGQNNSLINSRANGI